MLKSSNVVWNAETLDAWLTDPARYIPKNAMAFPGIKDARARTDLIAFLKTAAAEGKPSDKGSPHNPDLKQAKPESIVKSIQYCGDAYTLRTAAGMA